MVVKFSNSDMIDGTDSFDYGNRWYRHREETWERLVIGPSEDHVELLIALSQELPGPFGILYVLLVSRCGRKVGRYQNIEPISSLELQGFLREHEKYLEGDARHHLWIQCTKTEAQLVYDNHNVIYAYGPLDRFEIALQHRGFAKEAFKYPVPHTHHYNVQFDDNEIAMLEHWEWKLFPLQPIDNH